MRHFLMFTMLCATVLFTFACSSLGVESKTHSNKVEEVKIPILMYHTVTDGKNSTINTTPSRFKEHMTSIKKAGYNTITPFQLVDYYEKGTKLPNKPILITFDDGYKDNYLNAYPILKELKMNATIFAIMSRVQNKGSSLYSNEIPKITWEDISEMSDYITIQQHTWDMHYQVKLKNGKSKPRLVHSENGPQSNAKEVYTDFLKAQASIKEKLGYQSVMMAYPYGAYDQNAIANLKKVGVRLAVTVKSGTNTKQSSRYELNRVTGDGSLTGSQLLSKIK